MGQRVDERTACRISQDLAETKASHCEGGVSRRSQREFDALASDDAGERTQLRKAKPCIVISDEQLGRKERQRIQKIMVILQLQYTDETVGVLAESSEDTADAAGPVHQDAG